ncbi:hypothetical protein CVR96_26995, partial [Salmonella enterica subsp. enterica serovar Typhimurium]|uniref:hypothetical protein n=1 Tax=Salmonella enterica TaxID=28901 RepID=UPI000CCAED94
MSRAAGAVNSLESETEKIEDLDLDVDTSGLHSSIKEAQSALEGLEDEEVEIEPSTGTFNAKIAAVKASLKSIPEFETVHFIAIT